MDETSLVTALPTTIPTAIPIALYSLTNSIRISSVIYNGTDISELRATDENYEPEKHKNESLGKICRDLGLSLVFVNLTEFGKSGAALSCCCLHGNYISYPSGK